MKLIFALSLLLASYFSQAACKNTEVEIEVHLSFATYSIGYDFGESELYSEDQIIVKDLLTSKVYILSKGYYTDDGAGNFGVEATSEDGSVQLDVFHDHEVWHSEGLSGTVKIDSKTVDLANIKDCSYDDLFL